MIAVQAAAAGGPEVLKVVDLPVPEPGPGEVRVRHKAVGLNFIDTYQRSGLYKIDYPAVMGSEAAGVVEAVGEGVGRFKAGDRVGYATGPLGAYAEAHVVAADRVVALPDDIAFETAAAVMLKGMTVEYLIRRCGRLQAGDTILLHAAAGGVGTLLSQWASALGVRVIGAAGSEAKAAQARANGCSDVILYDHEDVAERVRALTGGEGVGVVYDSVGAATFEASLASLARRGLFVSFGNASGPVPPFAPLRLSNGSLFMTRPRLFDYVATVEDLDASAAALFEAILSGKVKAEIGQSWPLERAAEAHVALEGRKTAGLSILIP